MGEVVVIGASPVSEGMTCTKCMKHLPLDMFRTIRRKIRNTYCRPCFNRTKHLSPSGQRHARWGAVAVDTRRRARIQGVPHSLSAGDVRALFESQDGQCALTGVQLTRQVKIAGPYSPSLDRIFPERGYVKGNVRFVCFAVNAFKGKMTDAEMLELSLALVKGLRAQTKVRK